MRYSFHEGCFLYAANERDDFDYEIDPAGGEPWQWVRKSDGKVICEGAELFFVPMVLPNEKFVLAVVHSGPNRRPQARGGPCIEAGAYSLKDLNVHVIERALVANGVDVFDRAELARLIRTAVFGQEVCCDA